MKKDYQKPEAELISLIPEEQITLGLTKAGGDIIDGEMGTESSIF